MQTTIVSLYAGPGAGKSTTSALIYALLKMEGRNAELVREYAKDWAWEERSPGVWGQYAFLGKQIRRESMLLGKVDVIVTDSPVWLCAYYAEKFTPSCVALGVEAAVRSYYDQLAADGHKHFPIWVAREKEYSASGRYQTEEQAKEIDYELSEFLLKRDLKGIVISSTLDDAQKLVKLL